MAAVKAQVLRVSGSRCQEADPVSRHDAAQWVLDSCDFRFRPQKSVAASARVLYETVPSGHARHVMTEYSAEVPHLLVEQRRAGVGIAGSGKEQRMPALNADVLVIVVPIDEVLIRVVSEKTGQRVTHVCQRAIDAEVRRPTSACPVRRICACEKDMIVDVVAPQGATYCLCATEDGSCSRHMDLRMGGQNSAMRRRRTIRTLT
jgi:hypothetical protein